MTALAKKRLAWFASACGMVLIPLALAAAPRTIEAPEEPNQPQAVTVVKAIQAQGIEAVDVTGTIVAKDVMHVQADLDGLRITQVAAEAGDWVEAGAVLARLDDTILLTQKASVEARRLRADQALVQAQNGIDDASITLTQAQAALARSRTLHTRGIVSSEALEDKQTQLDRAQAALKTARQALALAQADGAIEQAEAQRITAELEKTRILAPASGRILSRSVALGARSSGSGDPLFSIARDGVVELEAEVSERAISRIRSGQAAQISISNRADRIEGEVRLVFPELVSASRLGRVRITLPSTFEGPVGAFARGSIEITRQRGTYLPASAVMVQDGQTRTVKTVEDGRIRLVSVEAGLEASGLVQIVSGLEAGQSVVLKSSSYVGAGDQVRAVETALRDPFPEKAARVQASSR